MDQKNISKILHHLAEEDLPFGAVTPPIFQTSIFAFKDFDSFSEAISDEANSYLYTRGNNPTVNILEKKLAALEHGEKAKLFGSGVAAISSSILAFVKSHDHIVCVKDCYSWTKTLLEKYLKRFEIDHTFVEGTDIEEISAAIKPNTKIIYLESPTTFTFKLQNLKEIAHLAKEKGIKTIIDNTWSTPIFQNPIDFGIDLVVHSASKYFGGHSDLVAGVVVGSEEDVKHIFETEFLNIGAVPDPFLGWLILRGLRTLQVRMERHYKNAMQVASFLENHEKVKRAIYPLLKSHPQHKLATEQMSGGSGLFSIELKTRDIEKIKIFTNSLRLFKKAVSWGGYESLVFPYAVVHPDSSDPNFSLVRLHIGLENSELLIEDLAHALNKI